MISRETRFFDDKNNICLLHSIYSFNLHFSKFFDRNVREKTECKKHLPGITTIETIYFNIFSPILEFRSWSYSAITIFDFTIDFLPMICCIVLVPCLSLLCLSIFYILLYDVQPFLQCVVSRTRGKILVNITKTPLFYFSLSSSLSQLPRCKELVAIHQSPVRYLLGHNEYKYFRSHVHAPFPIENFKSNDQNLYKNLYRSHYSVRQTFCLSNR